jgi:hypothetical protein
VQPALTDLQLTVDKSGAGGTFPTIADALTEWTLQGKPDTVISVRDNRTYEETLTIEPADGRWLAIEAADEARPHLRLAAPLTIIGSHPEAAVTLSGLLVEGTVAVEGDLGRLRLIHTTLVPGGSIALTDPPTPVPAPVPASIEVAAGAPGAPINQRLRIEIAFSIVGPLRAPAHAQGIWLLDSSVDGVNTAAIAATGSVDEPGPPLWAERVTILGETHVMEMTLASEVIFDAPAIAERRQTGCVRFSFVPEGSVLPKRYRCQPDLQIEAETEAAAKQAEALGVPFTDAERGAIAARVRRRLLPAYTSRQYGDPAYLQFHLSAPEEIATGAEDGSEMGVYCHLKQPQRIANLRLRLEEYLPFGLEAGLMFVT